MRKKYLLSLIILFAAFWLQVSCDMLTDRSSASGEISVSIKKPKVSSDAGSQFVDIKCGGDWTIFLVQDAGEVDWASLSVESGTGNKNNVRLDYKTNSTEQDRALKIILDNGKKSVSCTFIQVAGEYRPDDEPDNVVLPNGSDPSVFKWLELPSMDDSNLGYYCHYFKMDGNTYRNYSFGWSQKDRVALWVAYPLCKMYTNKKVDRTNAWALDPLLGENSSAPFGGYAGNYARGHQLPSADRLCCYDANAQTFYGTNMTPQLNEHNEGIWQNLESKVRTIAEKSDTTYVVTGVIVNSSSKKEKDSYGNSVTIPDAYFKVLLRYSKSSTLGQWNAAAFYLDHKAYSDKSIGKQYSMSVDALEQKTGIDFFIHLPAKIGADQAAKIEAADPANVSLWW